MSGARSADCRCTSHFLCRACFERGGPTLGEAAPHDEDVFLAGIEQDAFNNAQRKGARYCAERLSVAHEGALSLHPANRRYWEAIARGIERGLL